MELKQIKELMAAMGRTGTKHISIKKDNFEMTIEREVQEGAKYEANFDLPDEAFKQHAQLARAEQAFSRGSEMLASKPLLGMGEVNKEGLPGSYVTSPMVGTFYSSPSPEDSPFVKVGDKVDKNTVVCIIEAMKVMNEVKANITGTVAEILIESSQPVEFGTKLFRIIEA